MFKLNPLNTTLSHFNVPSINKGHTSGQKCMLVLHGRGDSLESYKILIKEINVTGLSYLLLNAPQPEGLGYSWYDDSYSTSGPLYQKSLGLLTELIEELSQQIDTRDLFLFGFSQGARLALDTLNKIHHKIGAAICLSPRLTDPDQLEINPANLETPVLINHGLYDPVIAFQETNAIVEKYKKIYSHLEFESYEIQHEIDIMQIIKLRQWINNYL